MKQNIKKQAIRRLRIAGGQIQGLLKMIANDKYCINIIHQSLAVKKALSGVEDLVLENHLKTHVVSQIKSGKQTKSTKEILEIYKLSKRK